MKKINEQIIQSKLLVGKILGSLNEEEKKKLEEWEKDPVNKKNEQEILNIKAFEDWNQMRDRIDTSEEWQEFITRVRKKNVKSKIIRMPIYRIVASIAAVLVIGFASYFAYELVNVNKEYFAVTEVNISPGTSSAQLMLANGDVINLDTLKEEVINEGNIAIENEKGRLVYEKEEKKDNRQSVVNTLKIPRGGEYKVVLPDGTQVWLNSDTELSYSVPFTGNTRQVELKGEAYFDVAHNKEKPFIVKTGNQRLQVLGTEFNVSSYSEDINIVTTLVKGKVKIDHFMDDNNLVEEILLPNDQLIFNRETQDIQKREVATYLYTSWKDGRFSFKNEPLESFFEKISRWYDVEVFITDESLKEINFTGDLPRYNNMNDILKIVEAEMSVKIEVKENKLIYVLNKE